MSETIQAIPSGTTAENLILAINDRLRRINDVLAGGGAAGGGAAATLNYGTHATRLARPVSSFARGAIWIETDRGNVSYQIQSTGAWRYVSGTMADVLANQPADLGSSDTGFLFLATDTLALYRWDGAAWVSITFGGDVQVAYASGSLTLTAATYADIAGATITLARAGKHLITGVFDMRQSAVGDLGSILTGRLVANGSAQTQLAQYRSQAVPSSANVAQQWVYTAGAAGEVVKLQAQKDAGTGTSIVALTNTSISALWVKP